MPFVALPQQTRFSCSATFASNTRKTTGVKVYERLILTIATTIALGGSVVAADLVETVPAAAAPAPVASVHDWSGGYAGLHAGYAWGDITATDRLATNGAPWIVNGASWTASVDGFVGGAQAGYNWQNGMWVFGVEGDLGYLGASGAAGYPLSPGTFVNTDGGFYATARGRLGVAFDRTLVYATGGWIGADLDSSVQSPPFLTGIQNSGFQSGWTAGAGVEVAFQQKWSAKLEYLYYDFSNTGVGGTCCGGGVLQKFDVSNDGHIVRFGVNFHFN